MIESTSAATPNSGSRMIPTPMQIVGANTTATISTVM